MSVSVKNYRNAFALIALLFINSAKVYSEVPRPDHVVICVLENHAYQQIIGSSSAPYINHLSTIGANMVEYYGLSHPSQTNYIKLFSGESQGVTSNNVPVGTPFSTPNLGASLLYSGFTFIGYSEDLPSVGSLVEVSGGYARKHSPWVHWQGTGTNQIPASCNQTLDNFPADFNQLPDLSFVIPNLDNAMHDGVDPTRIETGDRFVSDVLSPYVNWAMNNNSLLIVLFDEDDNFSSNHIPCIFVGPMVTPGNYAQTGYDHYDMLRTIQDMYGLPYIANSVTAKPIEEIWFNPTNIKTLTTDISSKVFPNPVRSSSIVSFDNKLSYSGNVKLQVFDILGNAVDEEYYFVKSDTRSIPLNGSELKKGIYFYRISGERSMITSGKFIVE